MDRRDGSATVVERIASFFKYLRRISILLNIRDVLDKEKNFGHFLTTYDSRTPSSIIVAGMQRTQSENDKQIKWLKKPLTTTGNSFKSKYRRKSLKINL